MISELDRQLGEYLDLVKYDAGKDSIRFRVSDLSPEDFVDLAELEESERERIYRQIIPDDGTDKPIHVSSYVELIDMFVRRGFLQSGENMTLPYFYEVNEGDLVILAVAPTEKYENGKIVRMNRGPSPDVLIRTNGIYEIVKSKSKE